MAVAIFSLVTAGAFAAINSLVNARDAQLKTADLLQQLQLANYYLERDITQLVGREGRGDGINPQPAVAGQALQLRGTRVGWDNPLNQQRSNMQRFQYRLQEGQLLREHWVHVDNANSLPDVSTVLLDDINSFQVRYQNTSRQWLDSWPTSNADLAMLPRAIETTIELANEQRVRRVFLTIAATQN